ncbi:hypothetical protein RVR_2103 [Actinacidiphila reveromycinica]|uniref:Uncharacterized protein n=1 Tax=Actinacidiphila reveromycinica TaxID=659352 RepID=A0A7U3VMK7_9ACTN|nr:hypothetical protein [Streptomyces sp. SN-593]BBA96688.1 hypothetical protein RVR_2103 [Streptomyces sp. SN-593]
MPDPRPAEAPAQGVPAGPPAGGCATLPLSVTALAVSVQEQPCYRPVSGLADTDDLLPLVQAVAELKGIPAHRLEMLTDPGDGKDVSTLALAALGAPPEPQPLFYVRSGPLPDPYVATLARLVHEAGWAGPDTGVTHLDELGGTLVFDLLAWAADPVAGATALICDEEMFADARTGLEPATAVALRVRRGPGPLEVLALGEGAPGPHALAADHRFGGPRACDGWTRLGAALDSGSIAAGERVLLHTRGPHREGWLLLRAADPAALERAGDGPGRRSAAA